MKPAVFHPAAQDEVEEAAAYYEKRRSGLGQDFRLQFELALGKIIENPQGYGFDFPGFRACPLKRFPYTIYYPELEDHLWVSAVAHHSRRPGYWARRRPG